MRPITSQFLEFRSGCSPFVNCHSVTAVPPKPFPVRAPLRSISFDARRIIAESESRKIPIRSEGEPYPPGGGVDSPSLRFSARLWGEKIGACRAGSVPIRFRATQRTRLMIGAGGGL